MEWAVELTGELRNSLERSFQFGPIMPDGRLKLEEALVDHIDGLKVEIFAREHPPPHFRVSYQGRSGIFDICTGEPLQADELRKWHRNIKKWHAANREKLIEAWNERRPTDCPVGRVEC
ncbi:MAG: DUF4160 domain-containing protein [Bacillota bacterium]